MNRDRMAAHLIVLAAVALVIAVSLILPQPAEADECIPEPASQWAPAGYVCPPTYGHGTASTWPGPGAAHNDCTIPWDDCTTLRVTSMNTGVSIVVTPVTWCHCWTGVSGPNGETERIIDLDPSQVQALGLDPAQGLWRVHVEPIYQPARGDRVAPLPAMTPEPVTAVLPDTAAP